MLGIIQSTASYKKFPKLDLKEQIPLPKSNICIKYVSQTLISNSVFLRRKGYKSASDFF